MTPKLSTQIQSKLSALRGAVGFWLLLRGLSILLAWIVVLLALSFAIDWWWTLEKSQRIVSMIVAVVALLYVTWRFLARPLAFELEDDMLAVRVEERHPELRNGLISALQFSRLKDFDRQGVSPQMVSAAIEQGNAAAQAVDFSDVLDRKTQTRNALIVLGMLAILGAAAVGIFANDLMRIWFNRIFLFSDQRYPRNTHFNLVLNDKGQLVLPRGDDWDAAVKVEGVIPSSVYLDIDPQTGSGQTQLMVKQTKEASDKNAQFSTSVKNVIEPFRFRIRGGDNRTDWIQVALVDRPSIESFSLILEHPQYTSRLPETVWSLKPVSVVNASGTAASSGSVPSAPGAAPHETRSGSSSVYALKGSTIRFAATSNKPLASAVLRNEKGVETKLRIEEAKAPGPDGKERDVSLFMAVLTGDAIANGTYSISLVDKESLESKRPTRFNVRIKTDKEPQVRAQLVGISSMITADARIPVAVNLRDDYAITRAGIMYQWRGESDADPKGDGRVEFTEIKFAELRDVTEKGHNYLHKWEVADLKLEVGMHLTFGVDATDNDTITGPKTGKSSGFFVRVVPGTELLNDLSRREAEQRQEFERLIKNQDDLVADSRIALTANAAEPSSLSPALRSQIMQMQKRQKLVGDRCVAIAKQYEQIAWEFDNNKLDSDGTAQVRIIGKIVDAITEQIDLVRKAPNGAARERLIQETINQQTRLSAEMREVLRRMGQWSSYQEVVNSLYQLLEAQGKVNRDTLRAHQARLHGIFGEDKPKPPVPPVPPTPPTP